MIPGCDDMKKRKVKLSGPYSRAQRSLDQKDLPLPSTKKHLDKKQIWSKRLWLSITPELEGPNRLKLFPNNCLLLLNGMEFKHWKRTAVLEDIFRLTVTQISWRFTVYELCFSSESSQQPEWMKISIIFSLVGEYIVQYVSLNSPSSFQVLVQHMTTSQCSISSRSPGS